jgi:hypothetical protein
LDGDAAGSNLSMLAESHVFQSMELAVEGSRQPPGRYMAGVVSVVLAGLLVPVVWVGRRGSSSSEEYTLSE